MKSLYRSRHNDSSKESGNDRLNDRSSFSIGLAAWSIAADEFLGIVIRRREVRERILLKNYLLKLRRRHIQYHKIFARFPECLFRKDKTVPLSDVEELVQ